MERLIFTFETSDDINQNRDFVETTDNLLGNTRTREFNQITRQAMEDYLGGDIDERALYERLREGGVPAEILAMLLYIPSGTRANSMEKQKKSKNVKRTDKKKRKANAKRRRRIRKMRLGDGSPMNIPFNVSLNDGTPGECVIRAITPAKKYRPIYPREPKRPYTGTNVEHLIEYCEEIKRPLTLYDITGCIFYSNDYPKLQDYPKVVGICHREHFYTGLGKKIVLNSGLSKREEPLENYIYYRKGEHLITDGIHKKGSMEFDFDFVQEMENSMTPEVAQTLLDGIKPLSFAKEAESGYTIDCNRCYYTTATEHISTISVFNVRDTWKPFDGTVKSYGYYIIDGLNLSWLGKTTNMYCGRDVTLLFREGFKFKIKYQLVGTPVDFPRQAFVENFQGDHKKANIFIGCLLKSEINNSVKIEIGETDELGWLVEDHPEFEPLGEYIYKHYQCKKVFNYLHLGLAIVAHANTRVFATHFRYGRGELLKVKTDSLTYSVPVKIPVGWKQEPFKPPRHFTDGLVQKIKYKELKSENVFYQGAPGTGKSYYIKNNLTYKYASAFTNKACLGMSNERVKGQTLHSLFNIESTRKYNLYDAVIWIDEISMIPRFLWAYIWDAYYTQNTRFIFSGDFNQTAPIGEEKMSYFPFLGETTTFTVDHRNGPELVKLREEILERKEKIMYSDLDFPLTNIAFTNKTVISVNKCVVEKYSFTWGGAGTKVIATETAKRYGIVKNESYVVISRTEEQTSLEGGVGLPNIVFDKIFTWGYCYTIHKAQGDTIKSPEKLGIHNWGRMPLDVKYTAITRVERLEQLQFYQ